VNALAAGLPVSRPAVSQHLKALHPHSANGRHGKQSLKKIAALRLIKLSRL
jgi:hypothetical protein